MATDQWGKSGLKLENIGPTFSSLTMLLGGKSLKIIDLLAIEFLPFFFVVLRCQWVHLYNFSIVCTKTLEYLS